MHGVRYIRTARRVVDDDGVGGGVGRAVNLDVTRLGSWKVVVEG